MPKNPPGGVLIFCPKLNSASFGTKYSFTKIYSGFGISLLQVYYKFQPQKRYLRSKFGRKFGLYPFKCGPNENI